MSWKYMSELKFIQFIPMDKLQVFKDFILKESKKDNFYINDGYDEDGFRDLEIDKLVGFAMYLYEAENQLVYFPVDVEDIFRVTSFSRFTSIVRDYEIE
jgi:hypothetical protein